MPSITIAEAIKILELRKPLSREQVRKAYRSKAVLFHPDKFPDEMDKAYANEKFIKLKEAYELLIELEDEQLNDPDFLKSQRRKLREEALSRQNTLPDWPIIDEVENVAQLFSGWNPAERFFFSAIFNFSAKIFNRISNKLLNIISLRPKHANLYGFDKLLRLFLFAVIFTAYILAISIVIILSIGLLFIPFVIFYTIYYPYQKYCRRMLRKHTGNSKIGEIVFMNYYTASLNYLRARIFLWIFALAPAALVIFTGLKWWSVIAALVYLLLWAIIFLSVIHEWKMFKQINAFRKSS